jgi:hypothetical protein
MTILEQLYASSGSEVIHDTLQITAGDQNYWLTRGWDNITVTLEDGQQATFEGCYRYCVTCKECRRHTRPEICHQ